MQNITDVTQYIWMQMVHKFYVFNLIAIAASR